MNRHVAIGLAAVGTWALFVASAQAHFLFIQICPPAEAGRTVEVYFSDYATAGDAKFVDKIAHTELWRQDEPGKFVALTVNRGTDRLSAALASNQSVSVIGRCEYGVLKRDKSFLLRYYPKAVSGNPEQIAKLSRCEKIPLEIIPSFSQDAMTLLVLREGKPLPNVVVTTIDADLQNEELATDATGKTTWKVPARGQYAAYVKHVISQSGTKDGTAYEEIREFATLAFHWPLDDSQVDDAAVAMFERAIAARATWQDFHGLTANVSVYIDGRHAQGNISVNTDGDVKYIDETQFQNEAAREWVKDQFHSLVIHRVASSGIRSKPLLSFADKEIDHPLGRLLSFHGGRFASTYRIRDDEITVVNRNLGTENMSLQMLESTRNAEGKVLPAAYQVQYRNAETGAIARVETFRNRWQRIGKLDLPEAITQTISSAAGVSTRSMKVGMVELKVAATEDSSK